jgi:hypothetical protein
MEITALSGSDFDGIQHGQDFSRKSDPQKANIFNMIDPVIEQIKSEIVRAAGPNQMEKVAQLFRKFTRTNFSSDGYASAFSPIARAL